jgi:hypothetical protein
MNYNLGKDLSELRALNITPECTKILSGTGNPYVGLYGERSGAPASPGNWIALLDNTHHADNGVALTYQIYQAGNYTFKGKGWFSGINGTVQNLKLYMHNYAYGTAILTMVWNLANAVVFANTSTGVGSLFSNTYYTGLLLADSYMEVRLAASITSTTKMYYTSLEVSRV